MWQRLRICVSAVLLACYPAFHLVQHLKDSNIKLFSDFLDLGKQYVGSAENNPFFPKTLEELAHDASFSIKIALISQISRVRVDVRLRLTNRDRFMLKWLVLLARDLLESPQDHSRVHVFIESDQDISSARNILEEMTKTQEIDLRDRIIFSNMNYVDLTKKDKLIIIYNPDNLLSSRRELLEDVQAICFHGALKKIPVVMTNPILIATAWNDFGPRSPLLLSDFAQAYFCCDDLFMMSAHDQWCGVVQRASSGLDLFMLSGLLPGKRCPDSYARIESWPDGMANTIRISLVQQLYKV